MGEALARKIMREHPNHGIDVVSACVFGDGGALVVYFFRRLMN